MGPEAHAGGNAKGSPWDGGRRIRSSPYGGCRVHSRRQALGAGRPGRAGRRDGLGQRSFCAGYSRLASGAHVSCSPGAFRRRPGLVDGERIIETLTLKQCTSVAHQLGRKWVLSELYGVTGWPFTFEGMKWIGDWHAVLETGRERDGGKRGDGAVELAEENGFTEADKEFCAGTDAA